MRSRLFFVVMLATSECFFTKIAIAKQPDPINFAVVYGGKTIGSIAIEVGIDPGNPPYEGVKGGFTVDKNYASSITSLEKLLAQDHLNWFQKVTKDSNPPKDASGTKLVVPYIDPPKDGYSNQWADSNPWYWDEYQRPSGEHRPWSQSLLLSNQTTANQLLFEDFPKDTLAGNKIDFSTFLISDYGNKTYDVLNNGFSWSISIDPNKVTKVDTLTKDTSFSKEFQDEIKNTFGWLRAKMPDSSTSTEKAPNWQAREVAPGNSLTTVQPTHGGGEIVNKDGSIVQYSKTVPSNGDSVVFPIPGIINGLPVTDAKQFTKKRKDPGTLYFSVFNGNCYVGNCYMTEDSLSTWLLEKGYSQSNELFMPDFFPADEENSVYYGVNWNDLLNNQGLEFISAYSFGQEFFIDDSGKLPQLPMYTFSSTPLNYLPGQGWVGTPLSPGTALKYEAFHAASVPAPLPLFGLAIAYRFSRSIRKRIALHS